MHSRLTKRLLKIISLGLALIIALVACPYADAANNKKNKKKPLSKKGKASELKTIDSVGNDHIVVGGSIYFIQGTTDIVVNGDEATLGQIKKGMQVSIAARVKTYGRRGESNTFTATRVVARSDNELAKKAAEENKKRKIKNNKNK